MTMLADAAASYRRRRLFGSLAMAAALLVGTIGVAPVAAQEAEAGDTGGDAGGGAPLEIAASTLYVSRMSDAVPPTLRKQVPPAAVCVVRPELCPEASEPVREGVVTVIGEANANEPASPVQPVPADTAAVSFFGGQTRYQTAIQFDLPPVPAGQEVVQFTVTLPQAQPSYEVGSPAFRRAVLAVFETIGPQDPAVLGEGLAAALQEDPIEVAPELIGIEACPLLSPFEPGGAPQASPDDELPQREEGDETVVDVDCIFGSNGTRIDGDRWSFDLTFAAEAWASGELANHGVLLRPIGAPNLAFGDPDTSTTAQVALDLTEVRAAMQTAEPAPPLDALPGMEGGGGFDDAVVADSGGFDDGGFDDGGFDDGGGFDGGGGFEDLDGDDGFADSPEFDDAELADDAGAPGADVAGPGGNGPQASALTAGEAEPGQPWWTWLLVPAFAGGAYLTTQALTATGGAAALAGGGVAASGAAGGGALSRLMARRGTTAPV